MAYVDLTAQIEEILKLKAEISSLEEKEKQGRDTLVEVMESLNIDHYNSDQGYVATLYNAFTGAVFNAPTTLRKLIPFDKLSRMVEFRSRTLLRSQKRGYLTEAEAALLVDQFVEKNPSIRFYSH
jgi:hypothetical protein